MSRQTITLDKEEFLNRVNDYKVSQTELGSRDDEIHIVSPLEDIQIHHLVDPKTQQENLWMERSLILDGVKHEARRIKVSEKYKPITLAEIFTYITESANYPYIIDNMDKIVLFINDGSLKISLKDESLKKEVMDVKLTKVLEKRKSYDFTPEDFNVSRMEFGGYTPTIDITNSFNKMAAFSVKMGLYRLCCMNGMTSFVEEFSDKRKHFKHNTDLFREMINQSFDKIPSLGSEPFGDLFDTEISQDDKDLYVIKLKDWHEAKKQSKTYKQDKAYEHVVDHMSEAYQHFIQLPEMQTVLDFTNMNSYFETPNFKTQSVNRDFSITINQVANTFRKMLNEVIPSIKSINI